MNLSKPQKQIYNMESFVNGSVSCVCGSMLMKTDKTVTEMKQAVNTIYKLNDALRIRISCNGENISQSVVSYEEKDVDVLFFNSRNELRVYADAYAKIPFELNGELCELTPVVLPEYSGILIKMHHIISDVWTCGMVASQFKQLVNGMMPVAYSYVDYLNTEDEYQNSKRYKKDKEYFVSIIKACCEPVYLSTKKDVSFDARRASFSIEQTSLLKKIAESFNTSVFVVMLMIVSIYISRIRENATEFFIGTTVLNRSGEKEKNTMGMYVNTVPVAVKLSYNFTVCDCIRAIEAETLSVLRHQKFNYTDILTGSRMNKLFDVIFSYQNAQVIDGDVFVDWYHNGMQFENLQVHVEDYNIDGTLKIHYDYRTDKFSEEEINSLHGHILTLLNDAIENPDKKIGELSMLSEDEKQKLICDFNNTLYDYKISNDSTLYSLFEKTAKEKEDKICIKTAEKEVTYGELLDISGKLDAKIRSITKAEKAVIAVIAERSIEMYSAIYGIIRGGNAYLPIDPDYPQERIEYILENSKAAAVVVQGKYKSSVEKIPCIDITEMLKNSIEKQIKVPSCNAEPEDTAYVIYTSGSTGNPKGAKISHKSAVNRILWMHDKYPLGTDDVILQKTPYTFDVSVWEHFWWGMCGGSLAVSKPGEHFLPAKILDEVSRNRVTHLHFVPSVFDLFLNYLETHTEERDKLDSVKYVFLSGETLTASLVERFYRLYDYEKVTLHNLYGPTECAVDVTYYDCTPEDIDPIPIGKPIYNTQMYVVDKYNNAVPLGVTGELCIAGTNVGQGYLNNRELTKEKFIDNPFGEGKLYRTGDLAFWREDGNIVFCGRKDFQIKLNGQRIEIGEIEAVVSGVPGVENAAVMVRHFNHRDVLIAFYCGKQDKETEIKDFCREKLPKYMVPSFVVYLDTLSLNNNGKLDRKFLAETELNLSEAETHAPIDDAERYICEVFEKILSKKNIGRNSDFFELGGTSLSMISLLSEDGFENITSAEFLKNPTPAGVAFTMHNKKKIEYRYIEPLYISEDSERVLILFPFAGGGTESYSQLISELKRKVENISVYFIRYLHSFEECAEAADEIAANFKDNEIFVYSHCVGAAVALQVIKALERKKIVVEHYFAGAAIPPENPSGKNIWKAVPDRMLSAVLSGAGARLNVLSAEERKDLLMRFRKDTDFANISFAKFSGRIKTPVSVIITLKDIFTYNYRQADKMWKKYAEIVEEISYIDSKTHYFQRDNSEELMNLLLSYMN